VKSAESQTWVSHEVGRGWTRGDDMHQEAGGWALD
jgi:hypothetical protein